MCQSFGIYTLKVVGSFFKVSNQLFTCQEGFTYYSYKPFYLRESDADCLTGRPH